MTTAAMAIASLPGRDTDHGCHRDAGPLAGQGPCVSPVSEARPPYLRQAAVHAKKFRR